MKSENIKIRPELNALLAAVKCAGGQTSLARRCNVSQQNVWSWIHRSGRVPPEHVIAVEVAVNGRVTRHELRPDIYPNEVEHV